MTKERKLRIPTILVGMCEDCAFYNDCPMEYLCPAAELIVDVFIEYNKEKDGKE